MNQVSFSEEELRQAAAAVCQSMLDALPPPSQCVHTFSPAFQAQIEHLIVQERRRGRALQFGKRIALVFLAVLASLSVWLGVDAQARSAFFSWVREVYEDSIVYRFFGKPAAEELPAYHITWLPDGYEEVFIHDSDERYSAFYQKGNEAMSGFVFEYCQMQSGVLVEYAENEEVIHEKVEVNGLSADFYYAGDSSHTNNLIWINEEAGIIFTIDSTLEKSVMLRIAESIF